MRVLIVFALVIIMHISHAATCQLTSETCTDSTPCKTISGQQVCLTDIGQNCWSLTDNYQCINSNSVNYCQPLVNDQPLCSITNQTCSQKDFNNNCMMYTNTWQCNPQGPTSSPSTNIIQLNSSYTLVSSNYDTTPCANLAQMQNCSIAQTQCTQTTPSSPLPAGITAAQVAPNGCFAQTNTYTCLGVPDLSDCTQYINDKNCNQTKPTESCVGGTTTSGTGQCTMHMFTYNCMTAAATSSTILNCSNQQYCLNGSCFAAGTSPDAQFGKAMVLMETTREGGNYSIKGTQLFAGTENDCHILNWGAAKCCKDITGAPSDYEILTVGIQASNASGVTAAATAEMSQIYASVSQYTYANLISPVMTSLSNAITAVTGATGGATGGAIVANAGETTAITTAGTTAPTAALAGTADSLAQAGITTDFTTVATAAPAAGVGVVAPVAQCTATSLGAAAAPTAASSIMASIGSFMAAAGPWIIAAEIVYLGYSEMVACTSKSDQVTDMAKADNLCEYIGNFSYNNIPLLGNKDVQQTYCCFNSLLALIINEYGRPLINKSWGSANTPDCSGFTPTQLGKIDFSKFPSTAWNPLIAQFMNQVNTSTQAPSLSDQTKQIQSTVTSQYQTYYNTYNNGASPNGALIAK